MVLEISMVAFKCIIEPHSKAILILKFPDDGLLQFDFSGSWTL